MKILLINPNRYRFPPVIPVGLEYLAGELSKTFHHYEFLDLCFEDKPEAKLHEKINNNDFDIVGITIRQIDTVLYHNNEYFLDEIVLFVKICKSYDIPVLLGGAGFSIMPGEILTFTGADYGIYGPGEKAVVYLLDALSKNHAIDRLLNGYQYFEKPEYHFTREKLADYDIYTENDGIVGFRTQIGCKGNCIFCTESMKPVIFHTPESVADEISHLKTLGHAKYHLCDSEFNLYLDHCIRVCQTIVKKSGPVNWALYMKPEPFSKNLFFWLKKSGASLLTLSFDTFSIDKTKLQLLSKFFSYANESGLKVAIDLSTGFPYENLDQLHRTLEFLDEQPVSTVGINSYYRVYPSTQLFYLIQKDTKLQELLISAGQQNNFVRPVFFNFFTYEQIAPLIENKEKFRLEGFEKVTNYQRLSKKN
jgi:radical SAM superfamily enzyme YgiQ (UPF0313 family)